MPKSIEVRKRKEETIVILILLTVTTLLQGGLYSMGCLDILSSVAGCVSLPLSKADHLV